MVVTSFGHRAYRRSNETSPVSSLIYAICDAPTLLVNRSNLIVLPRRSSVSHQTHSAMMQQHRASGCCDSRCPVSGLMWRDRCRRNHLWRYWNHTGITCWTAASTSTSRLVLATNAQRTVRRLQKGICVVLRNRSFRPRNT